jgi:large subunit ribosomal protein L54
MNFVCVFSIPFLSSINPFHIPESLLTHKIAKSKKLRRAAAKRQRKLEEKLRASGDLESLQPKIPITRQSIDLPSGDGTIEGSIKAEESRREVNKVMRKERRGGIREANFLKGM